MIQNVNKYHIYEIFASDGKHYFSIPKYQREYTWGTREWDALYDDISENNPEYFIGSIICIPQGDTINPYMEVIDGQQRLTTISLFLAAIYKCLTPYKRHSDVEDEYSGLKRSLKTRNSPNEMKLVPQVQSHNLDDYNYIMSELELKTSVSTKNPYFALRKMYRCYQHFIDLMEQEMGNMDEEAKKSFLLGKYDKLKYAMVVKLEVSSHSDAYVLFESLNNRGTPLTAIDLMKNLIMAKAADNNMTTDDCFNRWQQLLSYLSDDYSTQERFFRQYYNAFKSSLNDPFRSDNDRKKDPLGVVATKSNLLDIFEKLINKNLKAFLDDILLCGKYYSWLILQEQEDNVYKKNLEDLDHIQGAPSYLLLLYLLKNKDKLQLTEEQINAVIALLCKYFVRRNITDFPNTRDVSRIFMDVISQIEDNEPVGNSVIDLISEVLGNNCASDDLFKKCLEGDIYKDNVGAARYILCNLAESAMTNETWTDLWARDTQKKYIWTIEHIFPEGENVPDCWVQMIADGDTKLAKERLNQYTHKIGNLTVTGYNSSLSNKSFQDKRDRKSKDGKRFIGYKNGLDINKDIAMKESWTIEDIQNRTNQLVIELLLLYKFPGN